MQELASGAVSISAILTIVDYNQELANSANIF
jgi:hypothetical protein